MKKTLFIILLLIPCLTFSQNLKPINQVWGLKFGASKAMTLAAIKAKGGVLDVVSKSRIYVFKNINFGGRKPISMAAFFFQNKFYSAVFLYAADSDPETINYYKELVADVNSVYGEGQATKDFSSGFAEGDGNEITAIQGGNAKYSTLWHDDKNNVIIAAIGKNLTIGLTYTNAAIYRQYAAQQQTQDKADY